MPGLGVGELQTTKRNGVWIEPPGNVRRYFRYAPEFIDDPGNTGICEGIGPAIYLSPPVFASALCDVTIVGYRTLLSDGGFRDDEILVGGELAEATYLDKMALADGFSNENTGLRRVGGSGFELERGSRAERHIPGTTLVLCSHEPSNYGSLLFRVIPKLVTARELGLSDLPALVWATPPLFQRVLAVAGLRPERIIRHDFDSITRLDRAIAPSLRNPNAFLDRESAAFMQSLSDRFETRPRGRRLYVSRITHSRVSGVSRVMMNEEALAKRLADLEFEIIEPEQLSFEDQIAAFAAADIVVGPAGSGMFNTVFCRPGTKVIDIESETHWIYGHAGLFASCQLRYGLFVGRVDAGDKRPAHRRWAVDIDPLMDRLSSFLQA